VPGQAADCSKEIAINDVLLPKSSRQVRGWPYVKGQSGQPAVARCEDVPKMFGTGFGV